MKKNNIITIIPMVKGDTVLLKPIIVNNKVIYVLPSTQGKNNIESMKESIEETLGTRILNGEVFMKESYVNPYKPKDTEEVYKLELEESNEEFYEVKILDLHKFINECDLDFKTSIILQSLYWYYCGIKNSIKCSKVFANGR